MTHGGSKGQGHLTISGKVKETEERKMEAVRPQSHPAGRPTWTVDALQQKQIREVCLRFRGGIEDLLGTGLEAFVQHSGLTSFM